MADNPAYVELSHSGLAEELYVRANTLERQGSADLAELLRAAGDRIGRREDAADAFVLDLPSNPHPDLLDLAVRSRRLARAAPHEPLVYRYWQGGLDHMAAATGAPIEQVDAWVAHHDTEPDALHESRVHVRGS